MGKALAFKHHVTVGSDSQVHDSRHRMPSCLCSSPGGVGDCRTARDMPLLILWLISCIFIMYVSIFCQGVFHISTFIHCFFPCRVLETQWPVLRGYMIVLAIAPVILSTGPAWGKSLQINLLHQYRLQKHQKPQHHLSSVCVQ